MNQNLQGNPADAGEGEVDFGGMLDTLYLDRKLVAFIALPIVLLGIAYAFLAIPIYEANFIVQVEDSPGSTKSLLGEASSLFDVKTAASSEMEILHSRKVVAKAVDKLHLYIDAQPKYFPLIGRWLANKSKQLSAPGILGFGGYVWGNEDIEVSVFNVPQDWLDENFTLTAEGNGGFSLIQPKYDIDLKGKVGQPIVQDTPSGQVEILVAKLEANAGAQFRLKRHSRLNVIEDIQQNLGIAELGKQSGVIQVTWDGSDPQLTADTLNALGHEYMRQNVERKAEEAEKTISFLELQLPEIKNNVDSAETRYNKLRRKLGTVDIDSEAKGLLQEAIDIETKLLEIKSRRAEMLTRFDERHPSVVDIDAQLRILQSQKSAIQERIKRLPGIQQEVISSLRDVTVGTDLYTNLLNTEQQLRLTKASKIGSARLIDEAVVPEKPIRPRRLLIVMAAIIFGLFVGAMAAFIRKAVRGLIDSPRIIEEVAGLQVYATISESKHQEELSSRIQSKEAGQFILVDAFPDDLVVESLRSFRVALQFAMLDAPNNRVMITGPTPGVGKSFLAANIAVILGQAGKRVLLVDMDMYKGHLNQYFGLARAGGVSEILAGEISLEQAVHKDVLKNLSLITNGTQVPNPSSLFLNERLLHFLDQCSQQYDMVVVDASPALMVSDVAIIGQHMGTTFMVVRDGTSTIDDLTSSVRRLRQARVETKGVLFNGQLMRVSSRYGYGYGYGYRYGYKYGSYK